MSITEVDNKAQQVLFLVFAIQGQTSTKQKTEDAYHGLQDSDQT